MAKVKWILMVTVAFAILAMTGSSFAGATGTTVTKDTLTAEDKLPLMTDDGTILPAVPTDEGQAAVDKKRAVAKRAQKIAVHYEEQKKNAEESFKKDPYAFTQRVIAEKQRRKILKQSEKCPEVDVVGGVLTANNMGIVKVNLNYRGRSIDLGNPENKFEVRAMDVSPRYMDHFEKGLKVPGGKNHRLNVYHDGVLVYASREFIEQGRVNEVDLTIANLKPLRRAASTSTQKTKSPKKEITGVDDGKRVLVNPPGSYQPGKTYGRNFACEDCEGGSKVQY